MVMNEVGITGRMSANVCRCCKVQGNRALLYLSVVIFVLCQLLPISNTFHVHLQKKQSSSWLVHTDEGVLKMSMVVSTDTVPSNRNRPSQSNWNNANEVNTGAAKSSVEYELRGAIAKRQWANAKEILSNLSKCNLANGRNVVFVIAETCRRNQDFDQIVPLLQSIPNGILSFAEDDIMTVVNECADTNKMRVILPLIAFVFQQEEKMHLTPKLLAVLAKGYGRMKYDKLLQEVLVVANKRQIQADAVLFNSILDALIRCGQVNNALHLFQYVSKDNLFKQRVKIPPSSTEMPKYYQIFSNIRLNARSYNTLLKGIRFLDGDQVFTTSLYVLDLMKSRGIHPDSITINTIIDACAKSGNLNTARDLIMSSDVRPSIEAYSAIIGGYADRFKTDEALGMLEVMKDQDIKPNAFIITAVMNACFQSRNFQKAREVLRQARDLFGILSKEDLAALYSAYITGLCKSHVQLMKTNDPSKKISSKKYFLEAQNTMLKMLNKEMLPNIAAINAFMQSLCVFPQPFLKEALIFLKEAKKCQIIPDAYTYSILFGSLGKNGQVQQAIDLYYNASLASNLDTTAMNSLLRSVSICNPQRSIDLFYEIMNRMNHTSMVASDQFRNMAQVAVALPDAITFTTLYTSLLPKVFLFEQDYESDDSIVPPPKEQLEQDNDLGDVHSSDKESFGSSLQQQIRQSPIQGVYSSLLSIVKIIDIDRKKDSDDTNDNGMWGSATDGEKDWKPMSNKEAVFWKLYQLMRNEFNIIPDLVMAGVINTLFLHLFADGFLPRLDFKFQKDLARYVFQDLVLSGINPREIGNVMRACKFSAIQSRDYFDESYLQKLRDSAASSKIFLKHGWNEVDSGWSPLF